MQNSVSNHFGSSLAIIALQWHSQEVEVGGEKFEGEARIEGAKSLKIEGEARIEDEARDLAGRGVCTEPPPQKILENSYLKPCNLVYS